MKSVLGICDQDIGYSNLLGENLCKRNSFPFEISTFEKIENFTKAVKRRTLSVVLISETVLTQVEEEIGVDWLSDIKVIVLDEGIGDINQYSHIWKYQSSEKIKKEIMTILSDANDVTINAYRDSENTKSIIGVMSLTTGAWGSIGSLLIGDILSKNNKVLIISLKEFSALRFYINSLKAGAEEEDKDITDLVYYLRNGSDRFACLYESMVSTIGNIDYVKPAYSSLDLKSIGVSDWIQLINELKKVTDYKYIVIELSPALDGLFELERECSNVILFEAAGKISERVLQDYEHFLDENEYEDLIAKTCICTVFDEKDKPMKLQDLSRNEMRITITDELEGLGIL